MNISDKTISAAQKQALKKLYESTFEQTLRNAIVEQAKKAANRVAKNLSKDPKLNALIEKKFREVFEREAPIAINKMSKKMEIYFDLG